MKIWGEYLALISADAAGYADALAAHCADVILLPPCSAADRRIAAHPDTLFAQIGDMLITSAAYAREFPDTADTLCRRMAGRLILSKTSIGAQYPADVPFNIFPWREYIYGFLPHLSPDVIREAESQGKLLRAVKQGYAGCAALACGDAVITADLTIARAAAADGADVLLADGEKILLPGYSCGFIGGAGGTAEGAAAFFGTPSHALRERMESRGITVLPLADKPLTDFGGIRLVRLACR